MVNGSEEDIARADPGRILTWLVLINTRLSLFSSPVRPCRRAGGLGGREAVTEAGGGLQVVEGIWLLLTM